MFQKGVGSVHFKNPLRYPFTDARLLEDVLDIMDSDGKPVRDAQPGGDAPGPDGKKSSKWGKLRQGALGEVAPASSSSSSSSDSSSSEDGGGSQGRRARRRRRRRPRPRVTTKADLYVSEPTDPLAPSPILRRTDTDDSDMEGTLSNISRQVMRPPGCSGKAKRGHLCFDASFETGNLGRVDFVAEYDYDLFIRPDTCNPRYRFWFNFTVDNAKADQRAIFNLVNIHKSRNLFCEGLTPLVRSTSRPRWTRMPPESVYYYRSDQHRDHYVLSFAVCFDVEQDVYQFALTYPYSYSRLQALLDQQDAKGLPFCWRHTLALTVMKRACHVLTITSPANYKGPLQALTEARDAAVHAATKAAAPQPAPHHHHHDLHLPPPPGVGRRPRRVVVVMARVHGGESPTSFIVQGMLELLLGPGAVAATLREHVVFKIIPMLNPDGAFLGNYRSTLMGFDLNRVWGEASLWGQPTVHAARSLLLQLDQAQWCQLDLVLDLHAHTSLLGTFIYGNSYDDVYRHERHIVFPKMLSHSCEDYCHYNTIYNKDPSKGHSARRWLCNNLRDSANVYSIHTSIYGYRNQRGQLVPYTEDLYLRTGRSIVKAVLDYYQFLGLVPYPHPSAQPLHDLPRGKGPGSPPLHARHSRSQLQLQQGRGAQRSARGKWSPGVRLRSSPASAEPPSLREPGGSEAAGTDTPASDTDEDDGSSVTSDSDGLSDTSGLMVRIKQKAASADEDDVDYGRRYGHNQTERNVRLPATRPRDPSPRSLGERGRRRTGRRTRQPRTTYVTLFPEQQHVHNPSRSDDETRSLPDLPSLTASLRTLRTSQGGHQRHPVPAAQPTSLVWRDLPHPDIKLSYRYYDFRRLTRPRKRRHRRKAKSRSPSRARIRTRAQRRSKAGHRAPAPPPTSPERVRPRRMVAGGGFNVTRMATPPRGEAGVKQPTPPEEAGSRLPATRGEARPRGLRMIDVNQLTIGGYRESAAQPRWQASPRRPLPTTPPLLRRFLDPHAPLF